jgi:ABC-type uncharacterized transport system substrate-binding protein
MRPNDPVANGMAKSLARPSGNISGVYSLAEELTPKRLSLLKEVVPPAQRVGVLLRDDWPNAKRAWQTAEVAAKQLGLELVALNARSAGDLAAALDDAGAKHLDGIITVRNPTVVTNLKLIASRASLRSSRLASRRRSLHRSSLGPDSRARGR